MRLDRLLQLNWNLNLISILNQSRKINLILDIFFAYKNFSKSYLVKKEQFNTERATLFLAFTSAVILFVANIPSAFFSPPFDIVNGSYEIYLGLLLFISVFFVPLFLYFVAALLHIILFFFKGQGSFYDCRLAVFWSINVSAPILLFKGLLATLFNNNDYLYIINIFLGVLLGWIVSSMVSESEKFKSKYPFFIVLSLVVIFSEIPEYYVWSFGIV